VLSKAKGAKESQACKMPEAPGTRLGTCPNEPRQCAINLKKKCNIILYYIILYKFNKYIFPIKIDH